MGRTEIALAVLLLAGAGAATGVAAQGLCQEDLNQSGLVEVGDAVTLVNAILSDRCTPLSGGSGEVILKTGQTQCFNSAGTEVSCPGTGQDGELQLGVARGFTDNGDGTITDDATGLMWERLDDAGDIHDKDTKFTWAGAFNKVAVLNGDATGCLAAGSPSSCCTGAGTGSGCPALAGHTDWRLPNRFELESLLNLGAELPAIHAAFNESCTPDCTMCSCTGSSICWSATTLPFNPGSAWSVDFSFGFVNSNGKFSEFSARAVRSGS